MYYNWVFMYALLAFQCLFIDTNEDLTCYLLVCLFFTGLGNRGLWEWHLSLLWCIFDQWNTGRVSGSHVFQLQTDQQRMKPKNSFFVYLNVWCCKFNMWNQVTF